MATARPPGDVTASLWRALAALRLLLVAFALVVSALQWREHALPALAGATLGVITAWSAFTTWWYASPQRRGAPVLVVDMAVAIASLLATPYAEGAAMLAQHAPTVPTYWVAAPVLACAIHWGWQGGLVAALIEGVVDTSIRAEVIGTTLGNLFLLCVAAVVAGYSASLVRDAAGQRAEATALAAANAERERLGREVHDGVLQVLAYVQRRGSEIGGQTAELARLAGGQEEALRALVRSAPREIGRQQGTHDMAALLQQLGSATVSIATPGEPVRLPEPVATRTGRGCARGHPQRRAARRRGAGVRAARG